MSKSLFSWLALVLLAAVYTVLPSRGQNQGKTRPKCNCRKATARPRFKPRAAFAMR